MMNDQMMEEYIQDSLSLVDEAIDRLSSEECSPKCVNAIFRCLHTIKGASGFVGLETMSHFLHQFEGYLKPWQENNRGLNKEESQCIIEGLQLTQEALAQSRDTSLPESSKFVDFLNKIKEIANKYDTLTFSDLESILNKVKESFQTEYDDIYQKEIVNIGNQMERLLDDIHSAKKFDQLPVSHQQIEWVKIDETDITPLVRNTIEALEKVLIQGKYAFSYLNIDQLGADLNELALLLNKPGFLLSWDIIHDLCDISPEIIEEAFRRLWDECLLPVANIQLTEISTPDTTDLSRKPDETKAKQSPQKEKVETKKKEEYLRISATALQEITNNTGNLVADRNALENLIQEMGTQISARYRRYLHDNYSNLDKHVNALERQLNHLSNRQLNDVFHRLDPMVRSLSETLGKKVNLSISGGEIEIHRELIRSLNDPLVHIVRNSLDHGIESPEDRKKAGKPDTGNLTIRAERHEDHLNIRIEDDGKGLDPSIIRKKAEHKGLIKKEDHLSESDIIHLIFAPGFSTKNQVSDVSGRGVGMDVVRTAIESNGGQVHLESELGRGTVLEISLPLTEGYRTQDILLVKAGDQTYGIEYQCLKEILDSEKIDIHAYRKKSFFEYRSDLLPYVNLEDLFLDARSVPDATIDYAKGRIIVLEDEQNNMMACRVDRVYHKVKMVVVPFVHEFLKDNSLLRGTAVLGTGEPYLILDFRNVRQILNEMIEN
ncbi:MAG: chemotaxis protein CheW [Candidatus Magnetomorum sp.]|nr:chemotaxis protein CheW [Candidatus Magnetomorum sp.]